MTFFALRQLVLVGILTIVAAVPAAAKVEWPDWRKSAAVQTEALYHQRVRTKLPLLVNYRLLIMSRAYHGIMFRGTLAPFESNNQVFYAACYKLLKVKPRTDATTMLAVYRSLVRDMLPLPLDYGKEEDATYPSVRMIYANAWVTPAC